MFAIIWFIFRAGYGLIYSLIGISVSVGGLQETQSEEGKVTFKYLSPTKKYFPRISNTMKA